MAIERNFTGFEFADFSELIYGSGSVSGALNSIRNDGTARSGTYHIRVTNATNAGNLVSFPAGSIVGTTGTVTAGNHKRVSVRAYFRIVSAGSTGQIRMFGFGNDAGTCTVYFGNENTAGGFLQAGNFIGLRIGGQTFNHNPGVSTPFGSTALSTGVWYRMLLDLDILVDAVNSTLTASVRVTDDSDNPTVDFTVSNTAQIGANVDNIDKLAMGYSNAFIGSFGRSASFEFDDIVYIATSDTDAASGQPTLPTQTHIYAIVPPTGHALRSAGWTGTFADVDEYPLSGADTMSSSTAGDEVEFTHATGIALGYRSITAMKLYVNAEISGAGTGSVDYMLNGVAKTVTLGVNYPANIAVDPIGGVSFTTLTAKQFSATTFGLKKQNGSQATIIGNIGLEVIGTLAAYGSGNQVRGETQIKTGSIYDAQIADAANIQRHKIQGLNDGVLPIFFPEDPVSDDWLIPGPPGSTASVRIPVVPVFFPEDQEDAMLMAASSSSGSGGGSTTNNYNTYLGSQVLLAELTASASSSLDFASRNVAGQSGAMFQSDYDEYIVELINVLPATDNTDLLMRYSTDGGATYVTSAVYDYANEINNVANFQTPSVSGTGQTSSKIIPTQDNTVANGGANGSLKVYNPLSATQHKHVIGSVAWWNNDNQFYNGTLSFRFATTTAINAFRLLYSSGNIASGVVRVYGLTKTAQSIQNAPAHGLVLLAKLDASSSATVDFVSRNVGSLSGAIFQSDYDEYVFELVGIVPATNGTTLELRFSTDGGASFDSGANYRYAYHFAGSNNTANGFAGSNTATLGRVNGTLTNTASIGSITSLTVSSPLSTAQTKTWVMRSAFQAQDGNYYHLHGAGAWASTSAANAIRFLMASGNIASGSIRCYGVVKDATYPVSTIQTGTHASRPTAGNAGRVYLPNDGFSVGRDSGSAWETWGPLNPFTVPSDSGFSWLNQGTATIATTRDMLTLVGPGAADVQNIIARVKTPPATPYQVTAYIMGSPFSKNQHSFGLLLRQSGAGTGQNRLMLFGMSAGVLSANVPGWSLFVLDAANPTTNFGTIYAAIPLFEPVRWFRIRDDGTNTIFSVSVDGQTWTQILSQSRLTYLLQGPDQIGFWACPRNSATPNLDQVIHVLSWKQE